MITEEEKSHLLALIRSIPKVDFSDFGYSVSYTDLYNAYGCGAAGKDRLNAALEELETDGLIEVFRQKEFPPFIVAVRDV